MKFRHLIYVCLILTLCMNTGSSAEEMDEMWGESVVKLRADNAERGQLFEEGNYAMFIHWGLYSNLANKVDGKTYYGIAEWIMHKRRAGIPPEEYKKLAKDFNPVKFDAKAIAQLAKDAGMKYIIITSKHHDGFAMYDSKASDFDITDATPWGRDPMKELAEACAEIGLGFGFYYSHNQDWTHPGGSKGLTEGDGVTFDDYFNEKCLPQVEEITTQYGPMVLIWFDTPGKMPKHYVEKLVEVVRKNQPNALVSGRAGHGLGDYQTLGDMEIPHANVEGLWETVDTTNDSWAYAWYDEYWKTPKNIIERLVSCVARGGTYMFNIGPKGDGSVPERAERILRESGKWIQKYPQVVYDVDASPWQHGLPWGDVTVKGNKLFLSVFEWPATGRLYIPGLKTEIVSAKLLKGDGSQAIKHRKQRGWTVLQLPARAPEKLVSVVEIELAGPAVVDSTYALDPEMDTEILAEFAEVSGATKELKRWMEKFGEWKGVKRVHKWTPEGTATFEVNVLKPGDYNVDLTYAGEGRVVWGIDVIGGEHIQNEQNSSHNYQEFPFGWINFPRTGKYKVSVSCLEGNLEAASLKSIRFTPVM
ncbi:MAG: alpha-L-fucosidase [Puniceicoccaceae bacterium]